MAVRYWRKTAGNVLVAKVLDANAVAPADHDAVAESDIAAVYDDTILLGGTFVEGNPDVYTPPAGQFTPDDITTTVGQLRAAARAQRDRIAALRVRLRDVGNHYCAVHVGWAHDFLSFAEWGGRAVFLSDMLTSAQKLGWVQASAAGPSDFDVINNPEAFFGIVLTWANGNAVPAQRILFAAPTAPYGRFALADAKTSTENLTTLAADPTAAADIKKIATGEWINDIAA